MNPLSGEQLRKANEEAIYNVYVYLAHKTTPAEGETLHSIVSRLEAALAGEKEQIWKLRDIRRLRILKNAITSHAALADSRIGGLTRSKSGLTACTFTRPNGDISVVFKGTGSGEWIDNGEGLSGIPEENTYITYGKNGKAAYPNTVKEDYATDQQVEALNWFNLLAARNRWDERTRITVSGHSKGGNKAQFVAVHADIVHACYSFNGQGFSPEALTAMKKQYKAEYENRRKRLYSLAADNDYVNVLGERLVPKKQIYFFESKGGLHDMESMLDSYGSLNPQCGQGQLSKYAEGVSKTLMQMEPSLRQYATLGVMNVFQKYLGEGLPVNGDKVSAEKTIVGIGMVIGALLHNLR